MKVQLKVTATEKELTQAQLHRLKRAANMLRENDMDVELVFTPIQLPATEKKTLRLVS